MPGPRLSLAGTGNVAHELGRAFVANGGHVHQVAGRNPNACAALAAALGAQACTFDAVDAEVVLICVADSAVAEVSSLIPQHLLQAHTSGSVPMDALTPNRRGVFYPLQTFTEGVPAELEDVPLCLEVQDETDRAVLEHLGRILGMQCRSISSEQRKTLHLAAVLACNFSNVLYGLADEVLRSDGMELEMLAPLLQTTVRKAIELGPTDAQTGPARRADTLVLESHIQALHDLPRTAEVYQLLTQYILKHYHG